MRKSFSFAIVLALALAGLLAGCAGADLKVEPRTSRGIDYR